jgi:putative transposase
MADNGAYPLDEPVGQCPQRCGGKASSSSLKIERVHKVYRTRNQARADVFDYIERFYNWTRRHSTIEYLPYAMRRER